ncbi:hypothetical protein LFM09_02745 [Lentzea alba]|uniref:MauE/DoxX family redox-associated membrane protein n=1 Tax=Lentzea alba TaxID=2714351 RepID=UPI0039BFE1D5
MTVLLGLWAARLLAAVVFGWAAVAKLRDLAGTRRAVASFGVPDGWVRPVAVALPVVELVVAVAVLLPWTAFVAGLVAFGLLAVFSVLVARLLRLGRRPDCACFGASGAVSGFTLVRNGFLAVLVLVAAFGGDVPFGVPGEWAVATAVVVALGTVQVWQGLELRRLKAPAEVVQVTAPIFDLPSTGGGRGGLYTALAPGLPVVLLFLSTGCVPCSRIAAEVPSWRERLDGRVTLLVIGDADLAREHQVGEVLVQQSDEVSSAYELRGTPSAVLVDPAGLVVTTAAGSYAIRELVAGLS